MSGAKRLWNICEWGREIKKVGNHWLSATARFACPRFNFAEDTIW